MQNTSINSQLGLINHSWKKSLSDAIYANISIYLTVSTLSAQQSLAALYTLASFLHIRQEQQGGN